MCATTPDCGLGTTLDSMQARAAITQHQPTSPVNAVQTTAATNPAQPTDCMRCTIDPHHAHNVTQTQRPKATATMLISCFIKKKPNQQLNEKRRIGQHAQLPLTWTVPHARVAGKPLHACGHHMHDDHSKPQGPHALV